MRKLKAVKLERAYYKVYDEKGKLRRFIDAEKEKKAISEEDWLKGVSCFVINANNEVLIEQRVNKGLTPGKKDLCSGHIDNYETPTQAMLRELKEELGIAPEQAFPKLQSISGQSPEPLRFDSSGKKRNFYIYFFCAQISNPNIKFQKEEVADIEWVPLEECFDLIRQGKTKFPNDYDYEEIFRRIKEIQYGKNDNQQNKE